LPNDINNYPYREVSGRIPTMLYILGMYFYRLIMPARLLYDYSYNQIPEAGWANPVVLLTLLIILALAYFAIINLKRKSVVSFAILFFGATMSVGLMFVLSRGGIMAERFLYAPVLGFALVLGYYLHKLVPRDAKTKQAVWDFSQNGPKLFVGVIAVLLVFYSVRTVARNPVWKNNLTLFSNDITFGGNSAQLQKHYGSELINQSVAAEDQAAKDSLMTLGLSHVEKAIEINPRFSEAYFKLGYAYYQLREYPKAIDYYKKTNQNVSMNLSNMSLAYYMNGDYGEAVKIMQKAIQLNPENQVAKQNMPMLKQAFNRKLQAMKKEKSQDPQHFFELGNLFVEEANYKDALQSFDMAVSLKPDFAGALVNKGNCYYMLKDYNAAIKAFEAVLAVEPNSQIAFKNLSTLYGMLGNNEMQLFYNNKIEGAK
jgi:tetratricopeptide (TPR) repeat protein